MTRYLRQGRAAAQKAATFNRRFKVGDQVTYTSHPGAKPVQDRIYAPAEVLGGHTAVVWLAGQRSCVAVDSVAALTQSEAPNVA